MKQFIISKDKIDEYYIQRLTKHVDIICSSKVEWSYSTARNLIDNVTILRIICCKLSAENIENGVFNKQYIGYVENGNIICFEYNDFDKLDIKTLFSTCTKLGAKIAVELLMI